VVRRPLGCLAATLAYVPSLEVSQSDADGVRVLGLPRCGSRAGTGAGS